MPKLIVANWKMNPGSLKEAKKLAKESDVGGLVVCPPFPFLEEVGGELKKAELGAQDLFWEEKGAYTGEVSALQLKDAGVKYVIIGHSERRQNLGETDEMIAKKMEMAVATGLRPILCVGETKNEHAAGKANAVVIQQLKKDLSLIRNWQLEIRNLIVAYEPIWAIGTGTPDDPGNTVKMVELIREIAGPETQVLYGGSVTAANAENFLKHKEIAGALVGGASLKSEEIKKIVKIANRYRLLEK